MMSIVVKALTILVSLQHVFSLEEDDRAILSQMQTWGDRIFKLIETKAKGQYLVAAVMTDAMRKKPKEFSKTLLKGCPNGPNERDKIIECSTSAVLLNRESRDIWQNSPWSNQVEYENHPWHGEYILLNEHVIERLVGNFRNENGNDANCQVLLYSFYIPCADITGCPYYCSEQVANYNNRGDINCRITVIGYTEVFRRSDTMRTDENKAKDLIQRAQIELRQNIKKPKLLAIRNVRQNNLPISVQEIMYSCLYESPLSGCCVDDSAGRENSKSVIAYFVNKLAHRTINLPKFANKKYSDASREAFEKEFQEWIETQLHTECPICPYDSYNAFIIGFCAKTSLDLASGFGSPASLDLSDAKWNEPNAQWKDLYRVSPEEFLRTKTVMCAHRSMSLDSLCTRLTVTSITMPSRKRQRSGSPNLDELKLVKINDE